MIDYMRVKHDEYVELGPTKKQYNLVRLSNEFNHDDDHFVIYFDGKCREVLAHLITTNKNLVQKIVKDAVGNNLKEKNDYREEQVSAAVSMIANSIKSFKENGDVYH